MSTRRKRVISTEEIQFNHKPAKMLLTEKRRESAKMAKLGPSTIGICSYYVLDRPVFERCQTLLHPELTLWWSFLFADGAHHKKPHSPTHRKSSVQWVSLIHGEHYIYICVYNQINYNTLMTQHTTKNWTDDLKIQKGTCSMPLDIIS